MKLEEDFEAAMFNLTSEARASSVHQLSPPTNSNQFLPSSYDFPSIHHNALTLISNQNKADSALRAMSREKEFSERECLELKNRLETKTAELASLTESLAESIGPEASYQKAKDGEISRLKVVENTLDREISSSCLLT